MKLSNLLCEKFDCIARENGLLLCVEQCNYDCSCFNSCTSCIKKNNCTRNQLKI
jgi:hypothetical protein